MERVIARRDGPRIAAALGVLIALIYVVFRPPIYERDGYVYHLLGRDFVRGMNPHHLLWNALEWTIDRGGALFGVHSTMPFQLVGMACMVASAVLLYGMLVAISGERLFAFMAALFVALAPWTWFMAFQNQPYASMFLLFVLFLRCFVTPDGELPRGGRFAGAAAAAVGMVMLQQAAALMVIAIALCFFALGGWKRAIAWAAATGIPTAVLYILLAAIAGVRSPHGFSLWLTGYLRSQHSLQVRMPDFLAKSVMGIISTFINQDRFKELLVNIWSGPAIMWFYGALGIAMLAALAWATRRAARRGPAAPTRWRPLVWVSVASILSWGVFCFLWEPTNYYWFILLAPFFIWVAAVLRPSPRVARLVAGVVGVATLWNLYSNHSIDAESSRRNPEPQMAVIERHMGPADLLWVVDLGWTGDVDYDLLQSIAKLEGKTSIGSVSDVVGRSPDTTTWQRTLEDSTAHVMQRGGKVFISDRIYDPDAFDRSWENSPFADYTIERRYPVDWKALSTQLPAFVEQHYDLEPAGFTIGADSIWKLVPTEK